MGKLLNVVTCVSCETTTRREETFFNLSLDIEANTSLIQCMRRFSFKELLN
jgi:ubiquitin carboxyl-terminal hydrolase 12/46